VPVGREDLRNGQQPEIRAEEVGAMAAEAPGVYPEKLAVPPKT
jgi:hypothetical protein